MTAWLGLVAVLWAALGGASPIMAAEAPGPRDIIALIEQNPHLAMAAADVAVAKARLRAVEAALWPKLQMTAGYSRIRSASDEDTEHFDRRAELEVVQPLYDFGASAARSAAAEAEAGAAEADLVSVRNTVLLEGLTLYYELAAAELEQQARLEENASAFVRLGRAEDFAKLGRVSELEIAERRHEVEQTRLEYRRARTRNQELRLRLEELTGVPFRTGILPPPLPGLMPGEPDLDGLVAQSQERLPELVALKQRQEAVGLRRQGVGSLPRVEAYGALGATNRDLRGRDLWAVGARLVWPFYEGGKVEADRVRLAAEESRLNAAVEAKRRETERTVRVTVLHRADAWQQLVAARTGLDLARRRLIDRQTRYQQERVTDLGKAMMAISEAEAAMVRATGAFALESVRLAMMLGEPPARGLDDDFMTAGEGSGESDAKKP